ncbi:pyrroline-5-carboxylate reductase : Pyrroline-5-carboxylate reductase OS=Acanthamoeba castellanii str. Neff GN=ACA1_116930 PE=3 SV=1: F420_oxidored: P5CR_dimer [Gemmata massiliana]|uniref:Pyrroline-5-carboxylate reductase n=1 Tax=Gemmata massiliana TaxID=1210884 RepID=A0A6P2DBJ9_9BACT|nr:pyrroline-5-carboxylate reductase [Gemmata massiliana]VTR99078.1 pyrroline-5-carboxylate reductase : Pyrroline-5-carboxylate reductase OS=Acanthamoeba castellanii str. Neff GN=ACA1_116930 PE=3 SV=1: F420_oxidored: P5CR_dimer [Gemmata massiliana]
MPAERTFPLAVGFLGAGQMATALASAWAKAGLLDASRSRAADPYPDARAKFQAATGIKTVEANRDVVAACDVLVLAVKPQVMSAVLDEIKPAISAAHLIVSIAAGVTLKTLGDSLGADTKLVRVMPNTPCLVSASATGFSPGSTATLDDAALVESLFSAVGTAYRVPEYLLDAVTGLSGSGPAFVYLFIEALADGGVRCGLPRPVAQSLAAQTVLGAARMVLETGQHPGALKDAVASPGGTTIAGIHALERAAFRAAAIDAVEAATKRAQELGKRE